MSMVTDSPNRSSETSAEREERLYRRRRRNAIRRAEAWADGLVDRLLVRGHAVVGESIYELYLGEKRRQLDELERREQQRRRRASQ